MSAEAAARSMVGMVLLVLGLVLLVFAAIDLLEGVGLVYSLMVLLIGVVFLALSGRL